MADQNAGPFLIFFYVVSHTQPILLITPLEIALHVQSSPIAHVGALFTFFYQK